MHWFPNSEGERDTGAVLLEGESRHTDKFHRCLGHVRAQGGGYNPYAVCTSSIGYAGSYKRGFRGGARTAGGRAKKIASGEVRVRHEQRARGVHWRPTTQRVYTQDLRKRRRREA